MAEVGETGDQAPAATLVEGLSDVVAGLLVSYLPSWCPCSQSGSGRASRLWTAHRVSRPLRRASESDPYRCRHNTHRGSQLRRNESFHLERRRHGWTRAGERHRPRMGCGFYLDLGATGAGEQHGSVDQTGARRADTGGASHAPERAAVAWGTSAGMVPGTLRSTRGNQ